jgi:hypothetical protein
MKPKKIRNLKALLNLDLKIVKEGIEKKLNKMPESKNGRNGKESK